MENKTLIQRALDAHQAREAGLIRLAQEKHQQKIAAARAHTIEHVRAVLESKIAAERIAVVCEFGCEVEETNFEADGLKFFCSFDHECREPVIALHVRDSEGISEAIHSLPDLGAYLATRDADPTLALEVASGA